MFGWGQLRAGDLEIEDVCVPDSTDTDADTDADTDTDTDNDVEPPARSAVLLSLTADSELHPAAGVVVSVGVVYTYFFNRFLTGSACNGSSGNNGQIWTAAAGAYFELSPSPTTSEVGSRTARSRHDGRNPGGL